MTNIFVITAGSSGPQEHLELSIKNPISEDLVYEKLGEEHGELLEKVASQVGGFYAWGARPTSRLKKAWEAMQPGDELLCVYGGKYRYRAQIVETCHDRDFAQALWGISEDDGNTWEYFYFLTKPVALAPIATTELGEYLNKGYRGFTQISKARVEKIQSEFRSVSKFLSQKLPPIANTDDVSNGFPIDRDLLSLAVEKNLRPQIEIDGCLEDKKKEGYQHAQVIPQAQPLLTRESIQEDAVSAVTQAISCSGNLLFGNENFRPIQFLEQCDSEVAKGKFIDLLHGSAPIAERVRTFLDWAHWNNHELNGKPIGFNPTIVSYLLCVLAPEKYAFCKPGRYIAAARALMGDEYVENDPIRRLDHATKFYSAVLNILKDEHRLPVHDLMHVHIAFHLLNSTDHGYPDWEQLRAIMGGPRPTEERTMHKNLILYGPPGTGKTYSVVNEALAILDPAFLAAHKSDRTQLKARFDGLKDQGRICFVTFHQSYSYEEFVEGIRPKTLEGQVHYDIERGTFRQVCENDLPERSISIRVGESLGGSIVQRVTDELLEIRSERTGSIIPLPFSIIWELVGYVRDGKISLDDIGNRAVFDKTDSRLEKFLVNGYSNYFKSVVAKLSAAIEGTTPNIAEWPRVLVIDEINRGNISKIFGELITLIEEDKRADAEEALSVVLPYSGETFSVPSDLYIIGTMNTADRSLAHIDTALRRRFTFKEMMPKSRLLETVSIGDQSLDLRRMLDSMNERIEALFDREHQIGHSYLMKVGGTGIESLRAAFKHSILPLLIEYFFEDWSKVRTVLADDQVSDEALQFVVEIPVGEGLLGSQSLGGNAHVYRLNEEAFSNPAAYRKIYDVQGSS